MTRLRSLYTWSSVGGASASRSATALALPSGILALVFLALHLPYLPASLEDLDSINFALGVRHFDVARHQPHPPGYPLFIAVAKGVRVIVPTEAVALSLVSMASATLGVLAIVMLFRRLDPSLSERWSIAAAAIAVTSPLYWFTAARPLSDATGLAAALAVQAMTLGANSSRSLAVAGFCAGLAIGFRSQVFWLAVPLLVGKGLGIGDSLTPNPRFPIPNPKPLIPVLGAFTAGALIWAVPLVVISGGPAAYWHALVDQGAEDIGNIQMLWTRHGARDVADALYFAFIAPWAAWPMAAAVLVLSAAGVASLLRQKSMALVLVWIGFGPYLLFDLLFQETFTSRYALPLVVPIAFFAIQGAKRLPRGSGLALAGGLALVDAYAAGTSLAAYAGQKAPAFRLLEDMRTAAQAVAEPPVLAMDRRQSLDLRKPIVWVGDAMPAVSRTLPAPPQHEWLEAVKYWNGGGRAPVWFVVDPKRTSIDLVQHGEPTPYRWSLPNAAVMSGVRPDEMDWYRVDRPEWYVGEGWALTPEAAGVAAADSRDLSSGPIEGWIRRDPHGEVLMIGGRSFEPTLRPNLTVEVEGATAVREVVKPGAFLWMLHVPYIDFAGGGDYAKVTVRASGGSRVAIEQMDASSTRVVFGFGAGWQEQELNPRTGQRWRWLSERGEIRYRGVEPKAVVLHLEGESPLKYFKRPSRVVIRSRDAVLFDGPLAADFTIDVPVPAGAPAGGVITLETDQAFVPNDRTSSPDRRQLGLRIFTCELRPAS